MENFTGTKKLIFDTSVRLCAERGVESTSMRDIADAVGIQSSSIYNHFPSKGRLLMAMYEYFEENMRDLLPVLGRALCDDPATDGLFSGLDIPPELTGLVVNILKIAVEQSKSTKAAEDLVAKYLVDQPKALFRLFVSQLDPEKLEHMDLDALAELFACLCHSAVMRAFTNRHMGMELWQSLTCTLLSLLQQGVMQ